jgi:membrane protein
MALNHVKKVAQIAEDTVAGPMAALERHRYSTPQFVLRQALQSFKRHNGFGISASLSFYAMFALIPMALLIFFLLSHFVVSSGHAVVKLTALISHLVPKYSHRIMIEVYNISRHGDGAIWGVFGMMALLWVSTPLAGALRNAFFTIAGVFEERTFLRRNIEDALGVLGILALFFLFSFSGLMLEKLVGEFRGHAWLSATMQWLGSLCVTTLLITLLSRTFYPGTIKWRHLLVGALVTATLWNAMRPAFSLFLLINHSYGTIFGGMKNLFLSIGWLYFCFAVFILGIEVMSTLHRREVLLLRGLFTETPGDQELYHQKLMKQFGKIFKRGQAIFRKGENSRDMYYILSGRVSIFQDGKLLRDLGGGDYFGEMSFLTEEARTADAYAEVEDTRIVVITHDNMETLLMEEPRVSLDFLRQMANRLQQARS